MMGGLAWCRPSAVFWRRAFIDFTKIHLRIIDFTKKNLKIRDLKKKHTDLELHLTGPLQTNKVKDAVKLFDVFHTLDREKLAKEFFKVAGIENKKFFIQVNTGKEKTKSGIYLEELNQFINYCKIDLSLNIVGLMCIPPINDQPKKHFSLLADEAKKNNLPH